MGFRVPGSNLRVQQNQVYPTPSASAFSNHTNFSDQAMEGGSVDMKEVMQREFEKEIIREKIIAEEMERFHVLEAEVRRELLLGREMMALKFGGNIYGQTLLPEAKLQPPPQAPFFPAAGGSTKLSTSDLKKKMKWRCSICKVSAPCERGLLEHLAGKKHSMKAASMVINNSTKCVSSFQEKMEWRCPICEVSAPSERSLQDHLAGKKHQGKVAVLRANEAEKVMKSGETQEPVSAVAGSMEVLKKKMEWRCPICNVCATSEIDLQTHLAGRKHMKAKVAFIRKEKRMLLF